MAAGSMRSFYLGLGAVAIVGAGLIGWQASRRSVPPAPTLGAAALTPLAAAGPRGVAMGSDSAPVEIAEYSDFECPYCARFAVLALPDVQQRLVAPGRVRWRFMHYPLDNHRASPAAHQASVCAREQDRFWQMHDRIYLEQDAWVSARRPERVLRDIAERLGLDMDRYDSCWREQRGWSDVLADKRMGDSLGVNATPTIFVNGRRLSDVPSADQLKAIVDSLAPPVEASGPAAPARR
jgi:protein-disulfide isomerase